LIESRWGEIFRAVNTVPEGHRTYCKKLPGHRPEVKWLERGAGHPSSSVGL